jgi:DNA-binding transcriptional LysR family regulator
MNLNQLRVFNSVADALSITAAARALKISQPAVSKQLADFEHSLGTALVDRLPRGIRLTAAGELLASHARRIFQSEEAAERALAELLGLEGGSLFVGASTTIGSYLLPRVLGEFHAAHPRVALELSIGNTKTVTRELVDGKLDVGLTEGLPPGDSLHHEVLTHDEMVLITAPDHPWGARACVTLREIATVPLICREQGSGTREVIEAALQGEGLVVEPAMSLGSTEAVKHAVIAGVGVAFVSRLTVEFEVEAQRLRTIDVEGLRIRRGLHVLTNPSKHPSPAAGAFRKLLARHYPTS